ncbi:hypothetical protein AAHC03_01357 [Spirometra sp. Aus1]
MILQPPVLNVWVLNRTGLHSPRAWSTTSSNLVNTPTMVGKIAEKRSAEMDIVLTVHAGPTRCPSRKESVNILGQRR